MPAPFPTSHEQRRNRRQGYRGEIAAPRVPLDPAPLDDQFAELFAMTAAERVAAMQRGELTYPQLCKWAARHPEEVPLMHGEFCFIAAFTPELADTDA